MSKCYTMEEAHRALSAGRFEYLEFRLMLSPRLCQVFYHELFVDDGGRKLVAGIEGLPESVIDQWCIDYDSFASELMRGRFMVRCSDAYVLNFIVHYVDHSLLDDREYLELMFDIVGSPADDDIREMQDFIRLMCHLQRYLDRMPTGVTWSDTPGSYLRYRNTEL